MNSAHLLFLAQAATSSPEGAPAGAGSFGMLVPMILIFVIMYFLMIRPQQKRQKEHQKLVSTLKTGDKIVTNAGIHGIIANVKESTVLVKVADNVKIEFDRAAITTIEKTTDIIEVTKA